MKQCSTCKQWKDEEEFNWRYKALGIRHSTCRECHKGFRKNWYEGDAHDRHLENVKERKTFARETARDFVHAYLSTHPCQECGEADVRVLEFHHLEGKDQTVSSMVVGGYSVARIEAEIAKCIVLCANCHRKLTTEERGWYRGKK